MLIKIIVLGAVIYLILPTVGRVPSMDRVIIAVVATVVTYLIGDLLILPRWGSMVTAVADVLLIWASIMVTAMFLTTTSVTWSGALIIGVIGGVIEWFFHMFLKETPPSKTEVKR
jgi:hypothetical protein